MMKLIKATLLLLMLGVHPFIHSQTYQFMTTYGDGFGGNAESVEAITETQDGGFVVIEVILGIYSAIRKFNSNGDFVWERFYNDATINSIKTLQDGGFIACGLNSTYHPPPGGELFLMRLDSVGDTLWTRAYGGIDGQIGNEVILTNDGGFLAIGTTSSYPPNNCTYLVKVDSLGNMIWEKGYGGLFGNKGDASCTTQDGGYLVAGYEDDFFILKLDSLYNLLWYKRYNGAISANSITTTTNGDIVLLGFNGTFLFRFDSVGNPIWGRYIHDINSWQPKVIPTADNGVIIGSTYILQVGPIEKSPIIIKLDSIGQLEWNNAIWADNYDKFTNLIPTSDGGYALSGNTQNDWTDHSDYLFIKIDSLGNLGCNEASRNLVLDTIISSQTILGVTQYTGTNEYFGSIMITDTFFGENIICTGCGIINDVLVTHVSCIGDSTGAIDLTANTGFPPIIYSWSTGATTEDISGLPIGTYDVTVTDSIGCIGYKTVIITEPNPLEDSLSITNTTCIGNSDGEVDLMVSYGSQPYSFIWSNAATTEDLTNLFSGTYIVTVTDSCGVQVIDTAIVADPEPLIADTNVYSFLLCYGDSANIQASYAGGTGPFTVTWSTGDTTEYITNITAGVYFFTVTDSCGSVDNGIYNVVEPPQLLSTTGTTESTCNDSTGSAWVTPTGGTPPYFYLWGTGGTTDTIYNLSAGVYDVDIFDLNGCNILEYITVNDSGAPTVTINVTGQNACKGDCDVVATANATGGATPYQYLWDAPQNPTTQFVDSLCEGVYSVTVTDSLGCADADLIIITEPDSITANITTTLPSSPTACDGSVQAAPSGGTPPYQYIWDDPNNQTTSTATGLCAGIYCVTVFDANFCTKDTCVSVPVGINEIHSSNSIVLFPNPTTGELTIKGNFILPAVIELYDITGRKIYQQQVTSNRQQVNVSRLTKGLYVWQIGTVRGKLVIE